MKAAPDFVKSPYWDIYTDTVKPGAPPDVKAGLEKAYQEYLAEGRRRMKEWDDASQALLDARRGNKPDQD
ncbi:MAG: hypothetical protein LBK62_09880 [Treponema sp.]|jgi:hypothetical protein|nr:hypothetical protein [Treponema sp.]